MIAGCRVNVLILWRVFKVTVLGVLVGRGSGNDISRVLRFTSPESRYKEYLQLKKARIDKITIVSNVL